MYVVPSDGTVAPRNLTPGNYEHSHPAWLADSSGIVTSGALHEGWDIDLATDLHIVTLDGTITTLTDRKGVYYLPSVSPGGKRVAFVGYDDPLTSPQNDHIGVLELSTKKRQWVSRALDRTFATTAGAVAPIWTSDGSLLAYAEDRGTAHVVRVDPTGVKAPEWLTSGRRIVKGVHAAGGTIGFVASAVDQMTEVYTIVGGGEKRLSNLGAHLVAETKPQPGNTSLCRLVRRTRAAPPRSTRGS